MWQRLRITSIRTRLIISFLGLLTLGFTVLTLVAGSQISQAARADFEQRLAAEVQLVAQAIRPAVAQQHAGEISADDLQLVLDEYGQEMNGTLVLIPLAGLEKPERSPDMPNNEREIENPYRNWPELESAMHGDATVVERDDEDGQRVLATAFLLSELPSRNSGPQRDELPVVQLSVPLENLRAIVLQRWLVLVLVFAGVLAAAGVVSLWLARTIIHPLDLLRDSALRLSQGDLDHRVAYDAHDEVGQVAQAFNQMADEVQGMLEEQRAFASNTSHELRTPLTTIRLRSEALRNEPALDDATARQYIEEIDDEVVRLGNLVQDLTLLARFDAGRAEFGCDEVSLSRLASSVRQQVTAKAVEKQQTLTLDIPDAPLIVRASLSHLLVVFRNVLDNAIKYTPVGGEVSWSMRAVDGGVRSVIRDTGPGIAAGDLAHVFERFYRGDKSHSRSTPGTGLGLSLVKSIVDAYGGQITVDSDGPGEGTTVTIFWPEGGA